MNETVNWHAELFSDEIWKCIAHYALPPCWNDFSQLKYFFRTDKTHLYLIVSVMAADDLTTSWRSQGITIYDIAVVCLE